MERPGSRLGGIGKIKWLRFPLARVTVLAFAVTLIVPPALAGPPDDAFLVEDIHPGLNQGATPSELTAVGNTLFFLADDGENGEELWKSDGTPAGTEMVKDINGTAGVSSNAEGLTSFNGKLYFAADDGITGSELWVSDGTEGGTEMVKDFDDNGAGGPNGFEVVNGTTLYFSANGGSNPGEFGRELWKTDGTPGNTMQVANINPADGVGSSPSQLTAVGSTLYFTATDGSFGVELYKSNGTGAELVDDIHPSGSSDPQELTNFNGTLFFRANDGSTGIELYKSTGTSAEIVENPLAPNSQPAGLTVVGDTLFFAALDGLGNELWKSDGTEDGTVMVKDINPGIGQSFPKWLTKVGDTLFFAAAAVSTGDEELWRSDGTPTGTVQVKDINPPGGADDNSYPTNLIDFGGTLVFRADDGGAGRELWRSDGTEAGTVLLKDVNSGSIGSDLGNGVLDNMVKIGETLYFAAISGNSGAELWKAVDTIPPVATIGSGPPAASTDTTPTFGFSSNDPGTFQCRVYLQTAAAPGFGACSGPGNAHATGPLALGAYRFDVRPTDPAGNTGAAATRTFSIVAGGAPGTPGTPVNPPASACQPARAKLTDAKTRLAKAKRALSKAKRTLKKAKKAAKAARKSGNAARSKKARKKLKKATSGVKKATKKVKSARRAVANAEAAVRKACA